MKHIILFFGSFDPLHKGHISTMENAIKKVNATTLYIGVNKTSSKGKLTSVFHRRSMLRLFIKGNNKYKLLNFCFDYNNLETTYSKIFSLMEEDAKYYILVGQDQLNYLSKWYKYDLLIEKFTFIVAKRDDIDIDSTYLDNPNYIFIEHEYKNLSSSMIKKGNYENTTKEISSYISSHNLYLKERIKEYLTTKRYNHTLSVARTALLINKKANLGLEKHKVEQAALLHDIAKYINEDEANKIMQSIYPNYINESKKVIHQYIGEYIAKKHFLVSDKDVLNAIKFHTTGRANMSTLEKLIYVSDKIEPTRDFNTEEMINACINNFEKGFILVLSNNKKYIESKTSITNIDTVECFKYYLN